MYTANIFFLLLICVRAILGVDILPCKEIIAHMEFHDVDAQTITGTPPSFTVRRRQSGLNACLGYLDT